MHTTELIEKCLQDIPVPHCNHQANCTRVEQAIEVAIPIIAQEIKNMKLPGITPREYPNVREAVAACKAQLDLLKAIDNLLGENT
ncbi:hypothetical protein LCGC14_1380040 [marine sediment metagenome]|uniref:Uncharacterized protein n=1 Tax=marine sediment metagenome TaxID=412755 RepID=A0A0F9K3C5_9ZZZZ